MRPSASHSTRGSFCRTKSWEPGAKETPTTSPRALMPKTSVAIPPGMGMSTVAKVRPCYRRSTWKRETYEPRRRYTQNLSMPT